MRFITKATSFAIALAASASVASAQVSYSTTGMFGGPPAGTCNTTVCSGGGFTLTYVPVAPGSPGSTNIGSGSFITLGNFILMGTGNSIGGSVPFTLTVTQSMPTVGNQPITGTIAGTVSTNPYNSSTLVFTPSPLSFNIGPATYNLITDASGGYAIPINNAENPRGVSAQVFVTPEPSSYAMLGLGLAGLLTAARRRRAATA